MYDLVGDRLRDIFDAQVVNITVLDQTNGLVSFPYIIEKEERLAADPMAPIGFRKHVLETREPLLLDVITPELLAEYEQPEVLVGERPKSSVWVPLVVSSKATGVISLQNLERERAFSEADLRLLMTLAGSLSVALENARLFEETRQRNAELALINDVQRGLAENLDMQSMYDLVGDRIQEIFDAQSIDIGVLDREARVIHYPYTLERGVRLPDEPTPLTAGPGAHVLETREPLVISERFEEAIAAFGGGFVTGEMPMSAVYVPLIVGNEATGRISLQNIDREHAFSEGDVRLLTTLAGSLSVALENARLFEETRQRNAELALINDVQRGLAENLEMQAMYDLVGDRLQEIFDAQVVDIGVLDRDVGTHPVPVHDRARRALPGRSRIGLGGLGATSSRRGEPLVINERHPSGPRRSGRRLDGSGRAADVGVCSSLSSSAVRRPGRISLQNLDREHAFSEGDVRLLTTIAGQPQRRARERAAVRGDPAAQRGARPDQRRPARTGREPRDAGDVRPRRRASRADLRRTDGRHRGGGHGRRSDLVPVLDRARRSADRPSDRDHGVPKDRAGDARTGRRQRGHGAAVHRGGQPARDRRRTVTVVRLRPPADREPRDRRDLAPQPRSRTCVQRRRRPSAHDAGRHLERGARERAAVRGDGSARRGARHRQQRRTGAGRTARARRADRATRRPAP